MYSIYNNNQLLYESPMPVSEQIHEDFLACLTKQSDFDYFKKLSDREFLLPIGLGYPYLNDPVLKQSIMCLMQKPRETRFDESKLPPKIAAKIFDYQKEGVKKCVNAGPRALLADEPGLGKTLQSIAWASLVAKKKILIVAPPGLMGNWIKELKMWLDKPKYQEIENDNTVLSYDVDWFIISNCLIGQDRSVNKNKLLTDTINFDTMIIDEAHAYITPTSQRSKLMLNATIENMLFITGTPLLAKHIQLYVIMRKLYPEWAHPKDYYFRYSIRFCGGHKGAFGWEEKESTKPFELYALLSQKMVRRFTADVQDQIPPMKVSTLKIKVSEADLETYKAVLAVEKKLQMATKTKEIEFQISNLQMEKHRTTSRIKLNEVPYAIMSFMKNRSEKTIIWYKYDSMRDAILAQLPPQKTLCIGGDVKPKKRLDILNEFATNDNKQFLVLSIMACFNGLNIVCAWLMFFADNDYTPAIMIQCMGRIHRIGQTKPTEVFIFIAEQTYDSKILEILEKKDVLVNQTLQEKRKLVIEDSNRETIVYRGWEFEPYGISAAQVRMLTAEEQVEKQPRRNESLEGFIMRVSQEMVYDPQLITCLRRIEFGKTNQLNLNQISPWVNVFEYDKALPLPSAEKSMWVVEGQSNIIAIFMRKKDLTS